MSEKRWIPGYEYEYQIDTDGNVYSFKKTRGLKFVGEKLKPGSSSRYGHQHVYLNKKPFLVHRLVLETFVGKCPDGMECCHNDGVASNNKLENLRWDTRSNNAKDAVKHGTSNLKLGNKIGSMKGEDNPKSKLTEEDVIMIRMFLDDRISQRKIAKQFDVCKSTIGFIKSGSSWSHIKCLKVSSTI